MRMRKGARKSHGTQFKSVAKYDDEGKVQGSHMEHHSNL